MKTYVLTVSTRFPSTHPKAGQPTNFKELIFSRVKLHTIRRNYDLWKRRMDQVKEGKAIISLRYWSGKPYQSKQVEFNRITAANKPDVQKVFVGHFGNVVKIEGVLWKPELVADQDGLSMEDFSNWFADGLSDGAIIHFTDMRYSL